MARRIIHSRHLPVRFQVINTAILWWLALSHSSAPQWVYGIAGCLWVILSAAAIHDTVTCLEQRPDSKEWE